MLDLDQAIELATKAHKDQWKNVALYQSTQTIDEVKALHPDDKFEKTFLANVYNRSKPYITHPLVVMEMMTTDEEKIVAVLHDVFEDCKGYGIGRTMDNSTFWIKTPNNKVFISFKVYCALSLITYEKTTSYLSYITNMTQGIVRYDIRNKNAGRLATKVKIADIICNLADNPSEHQRDKYLSALPILLKSL